MFDDQRVAGIEDHHKWGPKATACATKALEF